MAVITGLTAERMLEIEASSVVQGEVQGSDLILTTRGGDEINAGDVTGPPGPQGPPGLTAIPGEVKLWPSNTLPDLATYGRWVWADGKDYLIADHPLAAAHISDEWNTFAGAANPGVDRFRVPDLRGLVASGMDAMPGGTQGRANRMTRLEAITLAKTTGKERHRLIATEMPKHSHGGSVSVGGGISGTATWAGTHGHTFMLQGTAAGYGLQAGSNYYAGSVLIEAQAQNTFNTNGVGDHQHPVSGSFSGSGTIAENGGDIEHENVQPTVFVPYIVCLDG